ncbi:MAG TPA: tRNA 2-thiouridine(34) synthase MnmA, partial [Solirubrobacterales bacterium]|nr:tRNA 2-thiouridine(34) synthase MnmA [Solirubrobacterales bacterium]
DLAQSIDPLSVTDFVQSIDPQHSADHAQVARPSAGEPERVLVALSGGVDSAVAALAERERGREVVAVTLKLWADPETDGTKACCSPEAVVGARRLSHQLGIPHLTFDLEHEFRRTVVARFLEGYAAGETPNPCVLCNGEVRIAAMVNLADRLGAAKLVTGHYARIVDDGGGPLLAAAADPAKDQGYMLAGLPTELLRRLEFPLADLTKPEVREIAARHGLAVARKPESQDLCFLAGQGKRGFLRRHGGLGDREGEVRLRDGTRVGRHRGHHHYTVGQRRGLGIASTEPLYVLAIDAGENTVTVGPRDALERETVALRDVTLHRDADQVDAVRLRFRSTAVGARVLGAPGPGSHPRLDLALAEPFAGVAPGQTAVLLSGERLIGHGTIDSAAAESAAPAPAAPAAPAAAAHAGRSAPIMNGP